MEKEYLTVKEFARERSCSTQYVYRLLQTKLQPYVVVVDGKKLISAKAFEVFEETNATNQETNFATKFATNTEYPSASTEKNERPSASTIEDELKRINERNEKLLDEMREEIKVKDAQLSQLNEKVISLFETNQRLMENNQKLQLNYQMLLSDKSNIDIDDAEVNAESAQVVEEPESAPEEPSKKKGLFSRLFGL